MKRIVVYQQKTSDVELLDDSDMEMDEYCQELSKALQMSNVVFLKTSRSTFIGRPSQLSGILVEELESDEQVEIEPEESNVQESVEAEIQEDIITDID